jgi:hypothetical protein
VVSKMVQCSALPSAPVPETKTLEDLAQEQNKTAEQVAE